MSFAAKRILKDFDINLLTKLLTHQLEYVTCLECCKYYSAPVTAECGHTLCNGCWYGRRNCPVCAITVLKKNQKLNLPLQNLTKYICTLIQSFEKLFNVKLADLDLELQNTDTNKNVINWLQNSQNKFSAPISNVSTQDLSPHVEYLTSEAQIHTTKVILTQQTKEDAIQCPQDDWDKIEVLDDDCVKNKENVNVETMDIDENELTLENPRRSNRKKDKTSEVTKQANKTKQTWNHAKKMRQEFNRLNKENRNKLNVSVETAKKPEVSCSKPLLLEKHNLSNNTARNITANESSKETGQDNNLCTTTFVNRDTVSSNQNSEQKTAISLECDISNQAHSNIGNKNNTSIDSGNPCDNGDVMTPKVKFLKKGALHVKTKEVLQTSDDNDQTKTSDDVVITIRVGKVITNVCIKQNESNPQIKIHTDRAVQTSSGRENVNNATRNNVTITEVAPTQLNSTRQQKALSNKKNSASQSHILISDSTKKNTASADTRTAQYEAASADKELIEMECVENRENTTRIQKGHEKSLSFQKENIPEEMEGFNDIFDCDFPKRQSVQSLIASKNVPSTILVPTQSKLNCTQVDKRLRNLDYDELPLKKKQRLYTENVTIRSGPKVDHSDCSNYDNVMEKVFANIDADIGIIQSDKELAKLNNKENSKIITQVAFSQSQSNRNKNFDSNQKDSENLFSNCDNDVITQTNKSNTQRKPTNVSHNETLTPNLCREFVSPEEEKEENREDNMDIELGTPLNDDSDVSIVEETPQKNVSNLKVKQKSGLSSNLDNDISEQSDTTNHNLKATVKNKISSNNVHETLKKNHENTDTKKVKNSIITPLTINKFVEQIQHKSTPVAKKSLNFNIKNVQDAEETLCKSLLMEQETTQEKEFMNEVFQEANSLEFKSNIVLRDRRRKVEFCVAGSCLLPKQTGKLRQLCRDRGWRFVDEYTHDVTHLIIEVDEENKCKRSLKYMRALAAGKWIIGFSWVEKCIQTGTVAPEEGSECLDVTGEPGPRRSRLAPRKLFCGITFYCMPSITMLDHHILNEIVASAGGRVVSEMSEVRVADGAPGAPGAPGLVLAEPDHTQDSKFQYLAMDVGIVPVHCEWALNSLGQYALAPLEAPLLLCSPTLLQPRLRHWPPRLRDLVQ